ncbi:MAG: hypothetical protein Q9199_003674 [Rusavskia elegans]
MASPISADGTAAALDGPSSNRNPTDISPKSIDPLHTIPPQYDQLVRLLHSLPPELFDEIRDTTLELAICPGHVFPQQHMSDQKIYWNGKTRFVARPELLRLSRVVYKDYWNRYWSENVFVIGAGPAPCTFEWLRKLPSTISQQIRKIHLAFTVKDLGEGWSNIFPQPPKWEGSNLPGNDRPLPPPPATGSVEAALRAERRVYEDNLIDIWIWKSRAILALRMTELTLDLTECYGTTGRWLGTVVMRMDSFVHGMPSELRIIAPNKFGEELVLGYFRAKNHRRG